MPIGVKSWIQGVKVKVRLLFKKKFIIDNCIIGAYQDVSSKRYKFSIIIAKNKNSVKCGEFDKTKDYKQESRNNVLLKSIFKSKEQIDVMINQLKSLKNQMSIIEEK